MFWLIIFTMDRDRAPRGALLGDPDYGDFGFNEFSNRPLPETHGDSRPTHKWMGYAGTSSEGQ